VPTRSGDAAAGKTPLYGRGVTVVSRVVVVVVVVAGGDTTTSCGFSIVLFLTFVLVHPLSTTDAAARARSRPARLETRTVDPPWLTGIDARYFKVGVAG